MQPSMELRWFFEIPVLPGQSLQDAQIPTDVQTWFNGGEPGLPKGTEFIETEPRPDTYLSLPDSIDLGVKVRAGKTVKVEVKRRHVDMGVRTWPGGVAGRVEQWVKWSFTLLPEQNDKGKPSAGPDMSTPAGYWLVVEKERQLRKFEVKGDAVEAVAVKGYPPEGCNLEITRLKYANRAWWSLGFESFGELETVEKNFNLVMNYVPLDFPGASMLKAEHSYAYPAWLGRVLKHEERKPA